MLDLWYKNAIIYCLDVELFMDGNGDGVGDFKGLTQRLDHLEELGVTCIWLIPFYPSPNRDNGYDISDYYGVDPRHGSLGDFVDFTRSAHDRGMRVIVDLVVNHTSIDHPWFQAARSDPKSPFRDWYVWSKEKPADAEQGVIFPGVQHTTWTYDRKAGEYYFHRFYAHQADLNISNPAVKEEIDKIMGFWLQLGVSGFRIDAVPFLIEYKGLEHPPTTDPHAYLTDMRDFLAWRKAEAVLLAEANIPMDQVGDYFGNGDRMTMVFNFMLNQKTFLSLAREDATPMAEVLINSPKIPKIGQWATFLRNHDEIDLGRLIGSERSETFAAFGPDPDMQVYGRGIRRRLAPMLNGDQGRLAMAFSILFALPGTPVIWYGDEIGMGDDLGLPERQPVRMPMQWDDKPNGGFSTAPPDRLVRPVIAKGEFGFPEVNVEKQHNDPTSLLDQIRRMIRVRRAHPEIGWGDCTVVPSEDPAILAMRIAWRDREILTMHNLAGREVETRLRLDPPPSGSRQVLAHLDAAPVDDVTQLLRIAPYGFYWFDLAG